MDLGFLYIFEFLVPCWEVVVAFIELNCNGILLHLNNQFLLGRKISEVKQLFIFFRKGK